MNNLINWILSRIAKLLNHSRKITSKTEEDIEHKNLPE
jgi:hypothetical protein